MALTPEDVVNKRFQPTKFREGYDQDEVDDFLDEVVVELRRLNQENEELRQRLIASDSRIAELQRSSGTPAPVASFEAPAPAPEPEPEPAHEPAAAAAAPVAAYPAPTQDPNDPQLTSNLLQLARRLHEEHVREGIEKRDSLIAEGHATSARLLAEAEATQRTQLTALEEQKSVLEGAKASLEGAKAALESELAALQGDKSNLEGEKSHLESEKTALEHRIEELRAFEHEYREKLKSYIEGQLRDLDASSEVLASAPGSNA